MKKLEKSLVEQKEKQLSHLEEEIKRRRDKKKRMKEKKLKEEEVTAAKAAEEEERRKVREVNEEHVQQLHLHLKQKTFPPTPNPMGSSFNDNDALKTSPTLPLTPPPLPTVPRDIILHNTDINQLILSTPLYSQLVELEKTLHLQLSQKDDPLKVTVPDTHARAYIDLKDAQWECIGDLVPLDTESLTPSDFVVYRFGIMTAQMLQREASLPGMTILLASNLPPNNYSRNCFRNSFFYQHLQNILYVRKERMRTVGEFVLVIIHCLAHIKVGNLVDDSNPFFLREFYKVCACKYHFILITGMSSFL